MPDTYHTAGIRRGPPPQVLRSLGQPRQEDGSWTQGETSFHTVTVWRDQATNTAETLHKGTRVIVVGRPKERTWTDQDGTTHEVTEVDAEEVGPSLRWATAKVTRTNGGRKASPSPA
jgi:single-strand DNA-binding protein